MDQERLRSELDGLQAELTLHQALIWQMLRFHPAKREVLQNFAETMEMLVQDRAGEYREEYLVELRARFAASMRLLTSL